MSDSLIREVNEEVRRDEMIAVARRYGPWVLAGVALAVLIMIGRLVWTEQQNETREGDSLVFQNAISLMDQGQFADAAVAFADLSDDSSDGFGALAGLRQAQALLASEDKAGALEILDGLANHPGATERIGGLAQILAASIAMDLEDADSVRARLQRLINSEAIYHFSALELMAFMDFNAGEYEAAATVYRQLILDLDTPTTIRQRATEMVDLMEGSGLLGNLFDDLLGDPATEADGEPADAGDREEVDAATEGDDQIEDAVAEGESEASDDEGGQNNGQ